MYIVVWRNHTPHMIYCPTFLQVPGVTGNVHTGAIPPWLRGDTYDGDAAAATVIGPSQEDFILHSMYM